MEVSDCLFLELLPFKLIEVDLQRALLPHMKEISRVLKYIYGEQSYSYITVLQDV